MQNFHNIRPKPTVDHLLKTTIHLKVTLYKQDNYSNGFLPKPFWILLILAVHLHLLGAEGQAGVAVEVEPVVAAAVRPLLLHLAVLRL